MYGVEGRYAHALFSASAKSKSLEKVEAELKDFQVRGTSHMSCYYRDTVWWYSYLCFLFVIQLWCVPGLLTPRPISMTKPKL